MVRHQLTFVREDGMSISGIGSATGPAMNRMASDGDSASIEAKETGAVKMAEQQNGGVAPKAAPAPAAKPASNTSDLARLRLYASRHMSAGQIATQLGKSVATVIQEAAAAGINLNSGSSGNSSAAKTANPAIGSNINTTA